METIFAMKPVDRLITVLPTGGGLSLLFMLPAVMRVREGHTTVVVVPFAALIGDVVQRARAAGVDCVRWQSASTVGRDGPERLARLVVVSADLTEVGEFTQYMDHVRRLGLLDYIFIDEGHTIVMDANYRQRLAELVGLQRHDCAMIIFDGYAPGIY